MAFIPHKAAEVGDVVKLLKPVTVYNGTFEAGTIVKIIDKTDDGFRIDDGYGHTASGVDRYNMVVVSDKIETSNAAEPENADWIYETGKEKPEILGSGSYYYNVEHTKDEQTAFQKYRNGTNNYLIRYKYTKQFLRAQQQYWDESEKKWVE